MTSLGSSPILLTGARGLFGRPLGRVLAGRGVSLHAFGHSELDVCDEAAVRKTIAAIRPGVVINCAAYTRVDEAEREAELAMRVNGVAPGVLAAATRDVGGLFVHISTDYVFRGDKSGPYGEDDETGPAEALCVYGRSKLAGERAVMAAGGRWLIVRTSWLFGPDGPNFVATIRRLCETRRELSVVNDQRGRPTYAPDLAEAIVELIERGATGVVHVANAGSCTWFEFAQEIVRRRAEGGAAGEVIVSPCTTAEFPRPARRPANSVLDTGRFEGIVGRGMRTWNEALREMMSGG